MVSPASVLFDLVPLASLASSFTTVKGLGWEHSQSNGQVQTADRYVITGLSQLLILHLSCFISSIGPFFLSEE